MKATNTILACAWGMSVGCAVERKDANADRTQTESVAVSNRTLTSGASAIPPRPLQLPQVALVDGSQEGEPGDIAATLYRVQLTTGTGMDTIPGVRTMTLPGVGADGDVYLFGYDRDGFLTHAYSYDPNTRRLTLIQVPQGVEFDGTHLTVSPDARHIAYIGHDSTTSYARGRVRSWPDGKLIAQTPAEPSIEGDIDYNDLRWIDANQVEFVYRSGRTIERNPTGPELWIHTIVAVNTREMKVDSLSSKPEWKR